MANMATVKFAICRKFKIKTKSGPYAMDFSDISQEFAFIFGDRTLVCTQLWQKAAQEEEKRLEEAERKKAALAALNVKQGPKTGMCQTSQKKCPTVFGSHNSVMITAKCPRI